MSQAHPELPVTAGVGAAPGAQLSQARRDLGLDVPQVAQRLRLPTRLIEAIERDDYAQLPGATYVRGYLRAYAGLLGIAPGPLLETHARLNGHQARANLGRLAVVEQVTSRHQHIRLTTYLVIAVVFGLAIAWWQAREAQRRSAPGPTSASTVPFAEEPGEPQALGVHIVEPPPGAAATMARPRDPEPRLAAAPRLPVPPPGSGLANITLHVEQEGWADVRDADDRRLLYENLPAGRTVSLQGVPPFSVYLGNAAGVRLEFNGEVQDLERLRRGPIARFRLGETIGAPRAAVTP